MDDGTVEDQIQPCQQLHKPDKIEKDQNQKILVEELPFDDVMYTDLELNLDLVTFADDHGEKSGDACNSEKLISVVKEQHKHHLIRLETISNAEFKLISLVQSLGLFFVIIYIPMCTAFARQIWNPRNCTPNNCDSGLYLKVEWFNFIFISIIISSNLIYTTWYIWFVLLRTAGKRPETFWALVLLPVVCLTNNPGLNIDRVSFISGITDTTSSALSICRYFTNAYALAAFGVYIVFKIGSLARSGNLDDPYSPQFYIVPTLLSLILFIFMFLATLKIRLELDPQPLVSVFSLLRTSYPGYVVGVTIGVGVAQCSIFVAFVIAYRFFEKHMKNRTFAESRLKHLNLHFFKKYTLVPLGFTIVITTVCSALYPDSMLLRSSNGNYTEDYVLSLPYMARAPIVFVYSMYAIFQTFVSIPSRYRPTWVEKKILERVQLGGTVSPRNEQRHAQKENVVLPIISWKPSYDEDHNEIVSPNTLSMDDCVLGYNISWLIYYPDSAIEAILAENYKGKLQIMDVWRDTSIDLSAMMLYSNDIIIIVFRGTVSWLNWKTNIKIFQDFHLPLEDPAWLKGKWKAPAWRDRKPKVHQGFWRAYLIVRDDIMAAVKALNEARSKRRIFVTGHSMGGALATLCCFDLRVYMNIPDQRLSVITYGSPKVGNLAFVRRYSAAVLNSFRVINHSDAVTNVPQSLFVSRFEHVPRGVLIDHNGNLVVDPLFIDLKLIHGNSIMPHQMDAYKASILAVIEHSAVNYEHDFWDFDPYEGAEHIVEKVRIDARTIARINPNNLLRVTKWKRASKAAENSQQLEENQEGYQSASSFATESSLASSERPFGYKYDSE